MKKNWRANADVANFTVAISIFNGSISSRIICLICCISFSVSSAQAGFSPQITNRQGHTKAKSKIIVNTVFITQSPRTSIPTSPPPLPPSPIHTYIYHLGAQAEIYGISYLWRTQCFVMSTNSAKNVSIALNLKSESHGVGDARSPNSTSRIYFLRSKR